MPSRPDLQARWEALSNIHRLASAMSQQLHDDVHQMRRISPPGPRSLTASIPELVLPLPHEIIEPLLLLQIPDRTREAVMQSFYKRVDELQQQYSSSYSRACLEGVRGSDYEHDLKAVHQLYQNMAQNQYLPMLQSWVTSIQTKVAQYQNDVSCDTKRPFNNEYTPVLEKYFDYNAYPSAKHQSILAEKSIMTKRQIEVWFQNHRNRAKKDNRVLKRLTSDLPLQLALSVLQDGNSSYHDRSPTPSYDDSPSEDVDEEIDPLQPTCCTVEFDSRPQHAFPTTYPPTCPDPFPSENGVFIFPPPVWMRTPTHAITSTKASLIDMDEFAKNFHLKLNIVEGTRKRAMKSSTTRQPWYAATRIAPSKAPHPAFIPSHYPRPSSTILPVSLSCSFRLPVGSRSTNAFMPYPRRATLNSRKSSQSPRRLPTPSRLSTAPSSSKPSRSSSFSSDTSSGGGIPSSSSRNSSPELSTPPPLPSMEIDAVQIPGLPQQESTEFDFTGLFGSDGDFFSNLSSQNFDPSMSQMLNKQPHAPLFDINSFLSMSTSSFISAQS